MSKFRQSPEEFLKGIFAPSLMVFASPDAQILLNKNNLSFAELIEPFSSVSRDGTIFCYLLINVLDVNHVMLYYLCSDIS